MDSYLKIRRKRSDLEMLTRFMCWMRFHEVESLYFYNRGYLNKYSKCVHCGEVTYEGPAEWPH